VGPDNRAEENPDPNFDTDLVKIGNKTDNSDDKQIRITGTSDGNFVF
jgi:hypothetical protein